MKTYLVGGAVRDQLLGVDVRERDWVVVGSTPEEMVALGYRQVGRDFPVFLHPETREEHALARTERKTGPGHTGFVCHAGPEVTLEQDLERRDLTINAMARGESGELIDPWGGARDLRARTLRHVSPAFAEDPLRVFRVARFAARLHHLGFCVADETLALMRRMASGGELAALSAERVWSELEKALSTASPATFFRVLRDAQGLEPWFSELRDCLDDYLAVLDRATLKLSDGLERFGAVGWVLDTPAAAAFPARLKAPRRFQRLVVQVAERGRDLVSWREQSAETVLAALVAVNAFREPGWLVTVCNVLGACSGVEQRSVLALADALRAVDVSALADQGLEGAALGRAIDERRTEMIGRFAADAGWFTNPVDSGSSR